MKKGLLVLCVLAGACDQKIVAGQLPDGGAAALTEHDAGIAGNTMLEKLKTLCEQMMPLQCHANQSCGCKPRYRYPSQNDCFSQLMPLCGYQGAKVAALRDGRVLMNEARVKELSAKQLQAFESCSSDEFFSAATDLFIGTVPEGGDCSFTDDDGTPTMSCRPGLVCELTTPVLNAPGTVAASCAPARQLDQPCTADKYGSNDSCASGLFCAVGAEGGAATCKKKLVAGQACSRSAECESRSCGGTVGARTCASLSSTQRSYPSYCFDQCQSVQHSATDGCSRVWGCGSTEYAVTCSGSACTCKKNTIVVGTFVSQGFCAASEAIQSAAASSGCGFPDLRSY